eukprot:TRINITY_DN5050_c0_g1_i1.p1 TRINITY_DN5050_c0_g1~~TRINITY_DN5050_c0_g1_i1.p1  ORF type:complete len:122 (+),score=13.41 TRINITY_DN5050_c0_g1_i1:124-489(+)
MGQHCSTVCQRPGGPIEVEVTTSPYKPEAAADGGGLLITFLLPNGSKETVRVCERPLGFIFEQSVPIRVKVVKADSVAASVGIRPGWVITSIGDRDVTREMDYKVLEKILKEATSALPGKP